MLRRAVLAVMIAALALSASGCVVRRADDTDTRTESRNVTGFDAVDFSGYGSLDVIQGDTYKLELTGPSDLVDSTSTEVRGHTLYIAQDNQIRLWFLHWSTRKIGVRLTVPELTRLKVSGAGEVSIDALEGDRFEFDLSGAGKIVARDLNVRDLTIDMSGAGSAEVAGKATTQDVTISGAGEYDGRDLESRDAVIDMSGAGSATLWATDTLDIKASGAGGVEYYGSPDVSQNVSGAGSVHELGAR